MADTLFATWWTGMMATIGFYSYDGPSVVTSACAFVNFPTNAGNCASWIKVGTNVVAALPQTDTNLSWAGYALDKSYSSIGDSDEDGISDYDEIRVYDTDPWLSDSDGDGLTDAEEVEAGTDPKDLYSFYRRVTVVTSVTDDLSDTTNYVAWGTSAEGWESNDMSCCWTFPATNAFSVMSTDGPMYVKSYRDLNRNGRYDAFLDPDADGLINLHEFWAHCDPSVPDGSNTVLSLLTRSIDQRILNLNPFLSKEKFLDYEANGHLGVYVPNTNFWLYTVDTTCASPWQNQNDGRQWAVTLITPKHVISASHHTHWVGCTHTFVGRSGNVYYRQVVEQRYLSTPVDTDICIGELNESLPTNDVMPACFAPPDIADYIANGRGLPMIAFDQEEKAVVHEVLSISQNWVWGQIPKVGSRIAFYEAMVSGDSSNPRFFLFDDQLVLVNVFWHGGAGDGAFVSAFYGLIQDAINSESPGEGFQLKFIGLDQYEKIR